jgi:hypothetical protein
MRILSEIDKSNEENKTIQCDKGRSIDKIIREDISEE